ncbi:hypothetical protein B0H14DRAFT_3499749 [Mycena olivaceomarginata]|nr:hypothetical protein B0H14DRAFT_3499749 [Mycena olivaceomarginata]
MDATERIKEEDSPQATIRVEDLWFPDHNLVLQAGNRLFRVSGGLLAARSPVFRDMLSIPQPDSQPLIDAIFDSAFFERPPALTTFHIVAGVLRLATKYDVEYLQHRALLHLSAALPRSLEEYDLRTPAGPFASRHSEFSLLILAADLGLTWALPMAMYLASCFPVKAIIDGIPFAGSDTQLPLPLQRTLLIGRSTLAIAQNNDIIRCLRGVNPLGVMNAAVWSTLAPLLCAPCYLAAEDEHRRARQKIWGALPAVFGLELEAWGAPQT